MKQIYLSIVIPAFNEVKNIEGGVLNEVWKYLKTQSYLWEVIIADDGSKDNTANLSEKYIKKHPGFRLLREPHRGKGGTVIAGVLAAKGKLVVFTDMDQATPIVELEKLLPKFNEGYDVVIGSRTGRKGAPVMRKLMAYGFALLRFLVLKLPFKDTQCGFKGFTNDAAKKIFSKMKIFNDRNQSSQAGVTAGFDIELLYLARKLGLRIAEVPVDWHHKGTERVSPVRDSWEGLRDLFRVRLNAFRNKYSIDHR